MTIIFELAVVVCLATILGVIARYFKQPLILAYIGTGVIIGLIQANRGGLIIGDKEAFQLFSQLGVMFLLFLIGLEMNYASIKIVGKPSIIIGLGQIIFTAFFGYIIAILLNFNHLHSIYIALALTFSSTIIVVKMLSDQKSLNSLYGKLSVGFLLVQDFVVILLLIILAGLEAGGGVALDHLLITFIIGFLFFSGMLILGRNIFPYLFHKIAESQELLFLASLAWIFGVVAMVELLEKTTGIRFSIEVAGFLAGLALANSSEHFQIANRIKPLRDFFILAFFVILGSSIIFYDFTGLGWSVLIFSLFVLIGNPLIVMIIMGLMRYRKRISFMAGTTVAQISEFSLVFAVMGYRLGHLSQEAVALIVGVAIITITSSTYLIVYSEKIYSFLAPYLSIFERKKTIKDIIFPDISKPIILIGGDRTGISIASKLIKEKLLIIDFNPEIIEKLTRAGYSCFYADIMDPLIFNDVNFNKAEMIISTNPNLEDNINLIMGMKLAGVKGKIILRARSGQDAQILYEKGADYVFVPLYSFGQYLGKILSEDPHLTKIKEMKEKDLAFMAQITQNE